MGFDPMTHRPRTDIFSSLPHLIALANLKEYLMEQQQQHHHYLQYLLQPPPPPSMAAPATVNNVSDMVETIIFNNNLLMNNPTNTTTTTTTFQENLIHDSINNIIPFSHLPDLQSFNNLTSSSSPSPQPLRPAEVSAIFTNSTTATTNDHHACSNTSSSFEGNNPSSSSLWPELLLDDPFFHEIA